MLTGSTSVLDNHQLYTFENDSNGISNCNDGCAVAWPPLLINESDSVTEPFSTVARNDGTSQWAINGKPLYFFSGDSLAGEQNGEGNNDVWFAARPAPVRVFSHAEKGDMLVATNRVLASQGKNSATLNQLTLYTFDDDIVGSGESTCFAGCAVTWPPLYAESLDDAFGDFEVITRTESSGETTFQWIHRGLPLYFFIGDSQLGNTGGDYPTWQIARP